MTTTTLTPPDLEATAVRRTLDPHTTGRRHAALVAGVGYVLLFGLAIFANFIVREGLVVDDDAAATATNIAESNGLFRLGLVSFVAIFLLDVVVAWALHIVFRDQHKDISLLAAWSRLVHTVLLGVAAIFLFQALAFYDSPALSGTFDTAQRSAEALVSLELFNSAWFIGLAAFGLHLIVLGALVARSHEAPRWLGLVMIAAGAAYLIDTTAHSVLADYSDHETAFTAMVAVPSVIAEGWFGLWLLLRAGRPPAAATPRGSWSATS